MSLSQLTRLSEIKTGTYLTDGISLYRVLDFTNAKTSITEGLMLMENVGTLRCGWKSVEKCEQMTVVVPKYD